jgi:hypothetical protein
LQEVTTTFGAAGFRRLSIDHIQIRRAPSLADYLARLWLRAFPPLST